MSNIFHKPSSSTGGLTTDNLGRTSKAGQLIFGLVERWSPGPSINWVEPRSSPFSNRLESITAARRVIGGCPTYGRLDHLHPRRRARGLPGRKGHDSPRPGTDLGHRLRYPGTV